jgi:hypothetical protein
LAFQKYNLKGTPRIFEFGLGLVNEESCVRSAFFFLEGIRLSRMLMVAPVYNASPGGRFFVAEHAYNRITNTAGKK